LAILITFFAGYMSVAGTKLIAKRQATRPACISFVFARQAMSIAGSEVLRVLQKVTALTGRTSWRFRKSAGARGKTRIAVGCGTIVVCVELCAGRAVRDDQDEPALDTGVLRPGTEPVPIVADTPCGPCPLYRPSAARRSGSGPGQVLVVTAQLFRW